jgi:hypothetical protein
MINYVAVAAATVINMVIGSLWYSPFLFGKIWAAGIKFKGEPKMTSFHLVQAAGAAFALALGIACILNTMNIVEPAEAIKSFAFLWLIFVATTHYNSVIWAQKPISVYLIDVTYFLATISAATALLAWWR